MWRIGVAVITVFCLMLVVIFNNNVELTTVQSLQVIAFGIADIVLLIWVGQIVYLFTRWMPFGWLHPALIGWFAGVYAIGHAIDNLSHGLPFFYH